MKYLKKIHPRYHKANNDEKSKILDEFCENCNYNRKYAIRKLSQPLPDKKTKTKRIRDKKYLGQTISFLEIIWEATNYICSQRLHAAIPIWLPHLKAKYNVSKKVEKQLLSISPSTIERRLKDKKRKTKRKIYGSTKPGTLLKNIIPIKTDSSDIKKPGFLEIDLVSHSGNCAEGDFIYSLNITDIHSTWTTTRAIFGKGQEATLNGIIDIIKSLPFSAKGIDSDNGSEFINHHLKKYCDDNNIDFTRSRPYKKDDNAHIEQKNWTHVRKMLGYLRYDSDEALAAINDLYSNELDLIQNLFLPSQKLIKKVRIGSKYKRVYDKPKTPLARLLKSKSKNINKSRFNYYIQVSKVLDPFHLTASVDSKLNKIYKLASKTRSNKSIIATMKLAA